MLRWDFWRRQRRDTDLDEEIACDLAIDAEERIRSGDTRQESEWASRRDFGNNARVNDDEERNESRSSEQHAPHHCGDSCITD